MYQRGGWVGRDEVERRNTNDRVYVVAGSRVSHTQTHTLTRPGAPSGGDDEN